MLTTNLIQAKRSQADIIAEKKARQLLQQNAEAERSEAGLETSTSPSPRQNSSFQQIKVIEVIEAIISPASNPTTPSNPLVKHRLSLAELLQKKKEAAEGQNPPKEPT